MGLVTSVLLGVVIVIGAALTIAVFFPQVFNQGSKVCQQTLSGITKDPNAQNVCVTTNPSTNTNANTNTNTNSNVSTPNSNGSSGNSGNAGNGSSASAATATAQASTNGSGLRY